MELMRLLDAFVGHELFLVTYDDVIARGMDTAPIRSTYFIELGDENILLLDSLPQLFLHLIRVAVEELKILIKERPDIIVTTGSEIAIPMCYMGKVLGKKVIFIESLSRVHRLSRTGRLIYPVASLFLVQWKPLTEKYKRARYGGRVM